MAASTNKAQAPLPLRQLLRGTPRQRIGAKSLKATGLTAVDLNIGANRKDLHHFGADMLPEPGATVKFVVPLDGANGGTGGGSLVSVQNPFGARVLVVEAILDVTTQKVGVTWQLGHASTATGSDASIVAAADTSIQSVAAKKLTLVTATGVVVPAADFFVAQASAATTGLVANLHINAVLL